MSNIDEDVEAEVKAARLATEVVIEISSALFDKSAAYTSLIVVAGYAGLFSIWAFVSEHLSKMSTVSVALLLGISLVSFVSYEIYKMVAGATQIFDMASLVNPPRPPRQLLDDFEEFQLRWKKRSSTPRQIVIWISAMLLAVSTAMAAAGLLFYNLLAVVIGWPVWPA